MEQHVLDDRVGALAVLDDLFEVVFQHQRQSVDFLPNPVAERCGLERIIQFVGQFRR
jgi:hypothetical protein